MNATISKFPESKTGQRSRHIPVTETAKIIRQALKEAFPEIKFSVRSDKYSGGSSINIGWTNGPHHALVDAIAKRFQGGYFDGMTDYKGGRVHKFKGEFVSFGGDFVFCNRTISDDVKARAVEMLSPLDADALEQMAFKFDVWRHFRKEYDTAKDLAYLILRNCPTPQFEGRTSPTADAAEIVRSY